MGLDNRLIAMGGNIPNPMEDYMSAQAQGMKVGAIRQEQESRNKLAQLMARKPANMPMSTYMNQSGMGDKALEYGKAEADIAKTQADTSKSALEGHIKQLDVAARLNQGLLDLPQLTKQAIIDNANNYMQQGIIDQQHVDAMNQKLASMPDNDAALRQLISQNVQAGMEAKDKLRLALEKQSQDMQMQNNAFNQDLNTQKLGLDQQQFALSAQDKERNYGIAKVRLNRDIQNDEFNNTLKTKEYQLSREKFDNPAKASKPTEAQSKAALYANRMQEAENILSTLDYSPAALGTKEGLSNVPLVGGMLGAGANMAMSKESQQAEQAQRNFINATLRRESGAVISPQEFENAKKQYFPSVGDSPEVLQQKTQNRQTAISALQSEAQGSIPEMSKPGNGATESWDENSVVNHPGLDAAAKASGMTRDEYISEMKKQGLMK